MSGKSLPTQGDIVWIDAEPHAGHEYGGHNPAQQNIRQPFLVMSAEPYHQRTKMVAGFPITSTIPPGFPLALKIVGQQVQGYAILSGLLGYDFEARHGVVIERVSKATQYQALQAVKDIFELM